jgi:hypothetical protein
VDIGLEGVSHEILAVLDTTAPELACTVSVPRLAPVYVNAAVPAALVVAVPLAALGPETWKLTEAPERGAPLLSFSVATIICAAA